MTIAATNDSDGPFTANGVTTVFPYTFAAMSDSEVAVSVDGVTVSTSLYTVSRSAGDEGGSVTFLAAPANESLVVPFAEPEFTQDISFTNAGPFLASSHDEGLDRAAVRAIYLNARLDRAGLPAGVDRAGMFPVFDAGSVLTVSSGTGADAGLRTDLAADDGGTLLGFSHEASYSAGSLGAQAKTRITVKDNPYLALGNGADNDTAALVAAAVSDRELIIPPGTYVISPTVLSNLSNFKLRGSGRRNTVLKLATTGTALTLSNAQWLQISDLSIEASGVAQVLADAVGVQLDTGTCNATFDNVDFYGFSQGAMKQIGTLATTLSGNTVSNCNFSGNGASQLYGKYSNDFKILNNQFGQLSGIAHATNGCYLEDCGEGTYQGNFHWNNSVGLRSLNSTGVRFLGNRIEESDLQGVYFDSGFDCVFSGNSIHTNSQTTDGASDNFYATGVLRMLFSGNKIRTWNAKYSRWGANFDTGCDEIIFKGNQINGFDTTNFGPVRFAGAIAQFTVDDAVCGTATSVAAGATIHMSSGSATSEQSAYIAIPNKRAVVGLYVGTDVAPGVGQSYTYTVRKNGADTAMVATSSGGASFSAAASNTAPGVVVTTGDYVTIKLVTSAGAAVANHRFYLKFADY